MDTLQSNRVNSKNFIGYEYKNITAPRELASIYADCYPYFGWEIEDSSYNNTVNRVSLTFKRNRKLKNKVEVNKLQRQFEQCLETISQLESSKGTKASIVAYTIGLLGTAFMAGSVFAVTAGNIVLCILLALPGFLGWGLGYVFYRRLYIKRSAEVMTEVECEYDSLYSTCEKAQQLLPA